MTLKGSSGVPRRALLAQTGVCGASKGTSETGGGTAEVRQVALDRSISSVSFAEHDEGCCGGPSQPCAYTRLKAQNNNIAKKGDSLPLTTRDLFDALTLSVVKATGGADDDVITTVNVMTVCVVVPKVEERSSSVSTSSSPVQKMTRRPFSARTVWSDVGAEIDRWSQRTFKTRRATLCTGLCCSRIPWIVSRKVEGG